MSTVCLSIYKDLLKVFIQQFSALKSYIHFSKFTPCLILKGNCKWYCIFNISVLVFITSIQKLFLYISFTLHPIILFNSLFLSICFVQSLMFSMQTIMPSANRKIYFRSIYLLFRFLTLLHCLELQLYVNMSCGSRPL